jgi:hypothetical protein
MICTVFAVAAIETFVYELGEQAFIETEESPHRELLHGLGKLVRDMEESRFQLFAKVAWIVRYLTGKPPDLGNRIFQDFQVLVRLRNAIIHLKDTEEVHFYQDRPNEYIGTPRVISQLQDMQLIRRPYTGSWLVAISTPELAEWSCRTAHIMAVTLKDLLPDSFCRLTTAGSVCPFKLDKSTQKRST